MMLSHQVSNLFLLYFIRTGFKVIIAFLLVTDSKNKGKCKGNGHPTIGHERPEEESMYSSTVF